MISFSTEIKEIRKFGLIILIFFGGLCLLGLYFKKFVPTLLFGTLALVGLSFLTIPLPLRPFYKAWLNVAHFLGKVITIIVLTLAYYLVITPSGLIKRLFGGTPIPTKLDRNIISYWVERTEPVQPRERFTKRY